MEFKISIIIPCYNVEQYIDRCMESIEKQTIGIGHLEIILVNDASTDGTLGKIQQWEAKFPEYIMLITYEENIRQGGARNVGLQYASGDYVAFVDSDDWIELDMYETLYSRMISGDYDVVKGKFIREHFQGEKILPQIDTQDKIYEFEAKNGLYYGTVDETGKCGEYGSFWTGLYKRELLYQNDLYFPERLAYEDNFFGCILKLYVKKLCIVDKVMYHYFVNPCSTVTAQNAAHQFDRLEIELMKVEEFKRRGAFEVFHDEIEWEFLQLYYLNTWFIIFKRFSYVPDIFSEMKKTIVTLFPKFYENPYLYKMNKREEQLMRMLMMNHDFTVEELERIKKVYLESM